MWKLNNRRSLLPTKRDRSFSPMQFSHHGFEDEARQNEQAQGEPKMTLAQLAARGDLDMDKQANAK
jgi:hypothetical protein